MCDLSVPVIFFILFNCFGAVYLDFFFVLRLLKTFLCVCSD